MESTREIPVISIKDQGMHVSPRWLDWQSCRHRTRWDYAEYQYRAALGRLPEIITQTGISSPKVLDVGCGLGGMSTAYAEDGGRVTAVDEGLYDADSIRFAEEFARSKGVSVTFLGIAEDEWPFADGTFDLVFLDSVIEHARSPERLLKRSTQALKPGGFLYISFPVFYGPFGGHIDDYIRWPWYHLLPRFIVVATLRRSEPRGAYVTPKLVEGLFLSLNRMTYRRFRRLIEDETLVSVSTSRTAFLTCEGNQLVHDVRTAVAGRDWDGVWRALRRIPQDFDLLGFCLFLFLFPTLPLMRIPHVQELFLGGIRATLRKEARTAP